ncbi:MAG: ABC transporter substrate-binding protein [Candidatus Thorarchaeota archaeon]
MRRSLSVLSFCCTILFLSLQFPLVASIDIPEDIRIGPFIDKVVYKVIVGNNQRTIALQSGVIDIGDVGFSSFNLLDADPNVEIFEYPRNGYTSILLNCEHYPLNISGFRRAFAFAFNKIKAVDDIYRGHASPHDSLLPSVNRWCAEELLENHYYGADIERGNALLDELGFTMNSTTGFRNAPNGEPFTIEGYYAYHGLEIADLSIEALHSLHIDTNWIYIESWILPGWEFPPSWDMTYAFKSFYYYDDFGLNLNFDFSNFKNETYDFWMEKFRTGRTYEEVLEASVEIQRILHYNVPQLVICQSNIYQGYRTDKFKGHVADIYRYISGPWTLRKMLKINDTQGGTVGIALSLEPDTFNFYALNFSLPYSIYSRMILENLYSSLYSRGPDMNPIPDLAESVLVETNRDNPTVPEGNMRFTFNILRNATWSDGTPLTAVDVAYTFIYLLESRTYGNLAADSFIDLMSVYAPSMYKVVMEFSSESYWHFYNIVYEFIIPKHIFSGIGFSSWDRWNPIFDAESPHVTCGPFILTGYDVGDIYNLTANPDYHYYPDFKIGSSPHTTMSSPPLIVSIPIMIATVSSMSLVAFSIAIKKGWISNKTN